MGTDQKAGDVLVSICLLTYNQENYIKQAVDSIVNQHIKFCYELLIADDASTDHTRQILIENYSNNKNIRLILRNENSGGKNAYFVFYEAKGKYLYFCEGDDYWIGQDGLQTLVDWLQNHSEFVGVCGRRITLSEKTGNMTLSYDNTCDNKEITLDDFLKRNRVFDMSGTLFKNFFNDNKYDYRYYLANPIVGDITISLYILLHGKLFQLDKILGVYRTDRIKGVNSYNTTRTPKMIFEEHIRILSYLEKLIYVKLDYSKLKEKYTSWYVNSFISTYDLLKEIVYIWSKVGIRIAIHCIKKRINDIRN